VQGPATDLADQSNSQLDKQVIAVPLEDPAKKKATAAE